MKAGLRRSGAACDRSLRALDLPLRLPERLSDETWAEILARHGAERGAQERDAGEPLSEREREDRLCAGELQFPSPLLLTYRLSRRPCVNPLLPTLLEHEFGHPGVAEEKPPGPRVIESCLRFWADPWAIPPSSLVCLRGDSALELMHAETGERVVARFRCGGWRCPYCGPTEARILMYRLRDALAAAEGSEPWWFCTFTMRPGDWGSQRAAYLGARGCYERLLCRLRRVLGGGGRHGARAASAYLSVWERTRRGWPHVHVVLRIEGMTEAILASGAAAATYRGTELVRVSGWQRRVLAPAAEAAGFGPQLSCDSVDDVGGLSGYFSKLASEVAGAKAYQQPVTSPYRFRRVRASRGLVPPRRRAAGWNGSVHWGTPASRLV